MFACSIWLVASDSAYAATDCTFRSVGSTMFLQGSCWTDATLTIPDGATLDGRGRTITARDPQGGHFLGAVVRNAGGVAHVRNLTIDASGLADVCDSAEPPDHRLRGILFEVASGTIVGNEVRNVAQAGSGCQEGNAIEVRGAVAADGQAPMRVTITGNRVTGYQKTGVLAIGQVEVDVAFNRITGLGPVDVIAQNGIQVSRGARGRIQWNRIEQNLYTGEGAASIGILVIDAGFPLEIERNRVEDNDTGIRLVSTSDAIVRWNEVLGGTYGGIAIDGLTALAQNNEVSRNRLGDNAIGIDLFGKGAVANDVIGNRVTDSRLVGIQSASGAGANVLEGNRVSRSATGAFVAGDGHDVLDNVIRSSDDVGLHVEGAGNDVQGNTVLGSGALDIENLGDNGYAGNRCATSSGTPIDCP